MKLVLNGTVTVSQMSVRCVGVDVNDVCARSLKKGRVHHGSCTVIMVVFLFYVLW